MTLPLPDPWSIAAPARRRHDLGRRAAVVVLASAGPVVEVGRRTDGDGPLQVAVVALVVVLELLSGVLPLRRGRPVAAAAAAAAVVVVAGGVALLGERTTTVAAIGVLVAHAALVAWQPLPAWPPRPVPVVGLAIAPAALAELTWARDARFVPTVALLVMALVVVELHHRAPGPSERVDHVVATSLDRLGRALGLVVLLVVATPLLYVPGAVAGLARRIRPAPTGWRIRTIPIDDVRRDASRPFTSTPVAVRRRRTAGGVAVLLVAGSVLGLAIRSEQAVDEPLALPEGPIVLDNWREVPYSQLPALADAPWADELQAEQHGIYESGEPRMVTVVDGERRTLQPAPCDCEPRVAWLLGGSGAYGIAQRDEHTIASELVRQADAAGVPLVVRNFAVSGTTAIQELEVLRHRLETEAEPPDLIVVYDGFNDITATVVHSAVAGPDDEPPLMDTDELVAYNRDVPTVEHLGGAAAVGVDGVRKMERVHDRMEDLAASHGVPILFAFQADAWGSPTQLAGFADLAGPSLDELQAGDVGTALQAASGALPARVHDLRDLLNDLPEPVFVSPVHHSEAGAEIVATRLLELIVPLLDDAG